MPRNDPAPLEPLAYSIRGAATALSVSPRQIYTLIERDGLPHVRIGGRHLIPVEPLRAWLSAKLAAGTGAAHE